MSNGHLNFFINNVKGIQSSKKRLRLFKYFENKLNHNGVRFIRNKHSSIKKEYAWVNGFNSSMFFFRGVSSSCGVVIVIFVNGLLTSINRK